MRQHALIGALIVAGAGVQAAPLPLGEDELRTVVAGKTVSIDTPLGLPLTVNYGANGIMTGTAGTALAVYLGSAKDRGRWHIKGGKLCQRWFKWLSGDPTCLSIHQDGLKIYWRSDDGRTGTAMIEPGPPVIEGATASGLGIPPQLTDAPAGSAESAVAQASPPASNHHAPPFIRREVVQVKPVVHAIAFAPAGPPARPPAVRESRPEWQSPTLQPPLVEPPEEAVRPAEVEQEPSAARFAVAALSTLLSIGPAPGPVKVAPGEADPFTAEREPMRQAAEAISLGVLEHRWCLANAFARGPSLPPHIAAGATEAGPELVSSPILLSIAQEQAYEGELPLHDPACLTKEPAIGLVAKGIGPEH